MLFARPAAPFFRVIARCKIAFLLVAARSLPRHVGRTRVHSACLSPRHLPLSIQLPVSITRVCYSFTFFRGKIDARPTAKFNYLGAIRGRAPRDAGSRTGLAVIPGSTGEYYSGMLEFPSFNPNYRNFTQTMHILRDNDCLNKHRREPVLLHTRDHTRTYQSQITHVFIFIRRIWESYNRTARYFRPER